MTRALVGPALGALLICACAGAHAPDPSPSPGPHRASAAPPPEASNRTASEGAHPPRPSVTTTPEPTDREDSEVAAAPNPPTPDPAPDRTPPVTPPASAGAATATALPSPQILLTIQNLEDDVAALEGFRPLLERVRGEVTLPADGTPPAACTSGLRDELAAVIRQGTTVIASNARGFRSQLDDLCGRFERWHEPREGQQTRMRSYVTHLDRVDEWMRDIRRCIAPGPYDRRCENAYGSQRPGDAEEARQAMRTVGEVRRALEGVPERRRFPCRSPLWERIARTRWTMTVARAQIPGLATRARSICDSLGVDEEELTRLVERTREGVDRAAASVTQLSTSRRSSLIQMRATFGLPAPPE